jgi:hypothetical protein
MTVPLGKKFRQSMDFNLIALIAQLQDKREFIYTYYHKLIMEGLGLCCFVPLSVSTIYQFYHGSQFY